MKEYIVKTYSDRIEYYNHNNLLHRLDGPAIIWKDGTQKWYYLGEVHSIAGPAVIKNDGTVEYWIRNNKLSYHDWLNKIKEITENL